MAIKVRWDERQCAECGRPMKIQVNDDLPYPSFLETPAMRKLMIEGRIEVKGAFQCMDCGRTYCWDHSFLDRTCPCGTQNWAQAPYIEPGGLPITAEGELDPTGLLEKSAKLPSWVVRMLKH